MENKDVKLKKIILEYDNGEVKEITRGVCFSLRDEDKNTVVSYEGSIGPYSDTVATLAVLSRIAKTSGVTDALCDKVQEFKGGK